MAEWQKTLLIDIVNLIGGGTPKTSKAEYWGGNINWLSVKDFNNENRYVYFTEKTITEEGLNNSSTKLLKRDDIIISARGTVGELAMIPFPMAFNQSCYGIRAKEGIDNTFLYYLIKNSVRKLKAMTHGSVFDTITRDTFANIEVAIPDTQMQHRIAKMLVAIDDKIENNQRINNNLEHQMETLFRSLFVENVNSAWQEGVLSDLGTIVAGGTPSKAKPKYYAEHGIAWITPKDLSLNKSKFISHGENDISELGFSKSSTTKMPAGTVLFSSRAPIGYIAIAANELTTNQGFKSVVPNENIGTAFMYFLLKWLLPTIERMASGSTFKEISGTGMKSVPVVIPDDKTIAQFNDFCSPIFQQQEILEAENIRLSNIRDALLPKLMSGELDVSDIDL
ncbi:restriction endonuclease subunit S [Thomasclavelia cocleata]|uniref:Type I restriction enzyme, S subunit n=1 Tax=Thomasclavelia cocleata TaxID=69824 RepID=A0A1I0FRS2_9FIRM|nr:restriction endonuclease subunit S [Thomasclavelia cocleata]MCR1961436.1 restriction endonuclease subunit S [Thomasclavelia cocleata]NDO40955.1 restriction endonuclease subunit S [Thomasclavelia cocleata]PJN80218.1 restriction endonuclease subunit S [Thomasclavelia cocleata]SET60055.1 type I restriction enzyme, S subunit [Thomasclavelia cocleata]